jgi:hypothetical protein
MILPAFIMCASRDDQFTDLAFSVCRPRKGD